MCIRGCEKARVYQKCIVSAIVSNVATSLASTAKSATTVLSTTAAATAVVSTAIGVLIQQRKSK
jgi:hypothetical protein